MLPAASTALVSLRLLMLRFMCSIVPIAATARATSRQPFLVSGAALLDLLFADKDSFSHSLSSADEEKSKAVTGVAFWLSRSKFP